MSAENDILSTVIGSVSAAILGVLGPMRYVFTRHIKRIDGHDERLLELEKESVTESKFDETIRRFERTMLESSTKNENAIQAVHRRLDELYRDIPRLMNQGRQ